MPIPEPYRRNFETQLSSWRGSALMANRPKTPDLARTIGIQSTGRVT